MSLFRIFVILAVAVGVGQSAAAIEPEYSMIAPELLAEIDGRDLPPVEDLRKSGLLPFGEIGAKDELIDLGFISWWYSHYNMMLGGFNDDLIGEADIAPVCYGENLTEHEDAPRMYRYTTWRPQFTTGYYNAFNDSDACERVYTDQVRYLFAQVKSDQDQDARMLVGADEDIKIWINGDLVMTHEGGEYTVDQYEAAIQLRAGWNMVALKLHFPRIGPSDHPDYEEKNFSLRFTDASGAEPLRLAQALDGWCDPNESYQWVYAGGVADLAGAFGSQWASDFRVINPYPFPLELTLHYYEQGTVSIATPESASGSAPPNAVPDAERLIVLKPYETRFYSKVLTSLFGVTPPQKGMLAIRGFYSNDAENYDTAGLKTYNQSGGGTFGSSIRFTNDGWSCCSDTLHGLRNGPGFRTNIAMRPHEFFSDEIEFDITLYDRTTGLWAKQYFTGTGNFQINDIFEKLGVGDAVTDNASVYIRWDRTANEAHLKFSASVVDNHTSDPINVYSGTYVDPPPAP